MPSADHNVSVTYSSDFYDVSFTTSGEGNITVDGSPPTGASTSYGHGSSVQLAAVPAADWAFVGWFSQNLAISSQASFEYLVTSADNLTAVFREEPVFLTILASAGGTTDQEPQEPAYSRGDTVTLSANPEPGWEFVTWEFSVPTGLRLTDRSVQLEVIQNTTAQAIFVQRSYLALVIQTEPSEVPADLPEPVIPEPVLPTWQNLGGSRGEYSDVIIHGGRLFMTSRSVGNKGGGIESAIFTSQCAKETELTLHYDKPVFSIGFWSNPDAAVAGTDGNGLLYSLNGGLDWNKSASRVVDRILSVGYAENGSVYATRNETDNEVGLYRSQDSGISWEVFSDDQPIDPNFVRPIGAEVWIGALADGIRMLNLDESSPRLRTVNGGLSNAAVSTWDIAETDNQLFLATEDGVYYRSRTIGDIWQAYGLQGENVRSLAIGNGMLYAGTWENGVWERPISLVDSTWVPSGENASPQNRIRRLTYVDSCNGLLAASDNGIWLLK